ncbi:thiol:disulfide interchange protein DsbA/DsbL [Lysobacter sp. 5GHs7-4]|uniref:thiol:disulfide interchange protein DsbA/DsbL n=1 Tax=Lysobacter sp. 5GHs7-4 TaxID=2904253 RepID=UPI001E45E348|nr:thiol:disulfide interchange protein DsbA/DsbL [Lysobacter sp. 5GHs7-4]UHQ23751.1 thiol:disulfide interchange protein DsbA/DsbL [Lysobacter sp. 5GHs7-4]
MTSRPTSFRLLPTLAALALSALLPLAASAAGKSAAPVLEAGRDYVLIDDGRPYAPVKGKIEVVEVFGYTCPHCAHAQPAIDRWKAKLPKDVSFVPVAAPFGGYWQPYAKAYYTAQSMGLVAKTHDAVFKALHEEQSLPINNASSSEIANFYARYGADAGKFAAAMDSQAIEDKLDSVRAFLTRSGVEGTPTFIVAGKYRVTGGSSLEEVLRITDGLVAQERSRGKSKR